MFGPNDNETEEFDSASANAYQLFPTAKPAAGPSEFWRY